MYTEKMFSIMFNWELGTPFPNIAKIGGTQLFMLDG